MKLSFTLPVIAFSVLSGSLQAQTTTVETKVNQQTTTKNTKYNKPYLDLNMGATWQTSDMKPYAGFAWGFGFGKWYLQNEKRMFDMGWRLRYLEGNTYGLDHKRNYGITNNLAVNGFNGGPDYKAKGYVFHNYKMRLNEISAELMFGANKLRERTRIMLYVWGGAGLTYHRTFTNQLDGSGLEYNYALIDSTGNQGVVLNQLDNVLDNTYETVADNGNAKWSFMPSAGIGLGYRFSKGFSMGVEFKTTWALNNIIDGKQYNDDNTIASGNDKYHYGGAYMRFAFGTKPAKSGGGPAPDNRHSDPNAYKNPDPYKEPYKDPYKDPYKNPTHNTQPTEPKPEVIITSPTNNFISPTVNASVSAIVKHVKTSNNITVMMNGNRVTNFSYNPATEVLGINANLANGNNTFTITGTNPQGSDTKSTNLIYNDPNLNKQGGGGGGRTGPPIVTITYPSPSPMNTTSPNLTLNATVLNVNSSKEIFLQANGQNTTNFTYNPNTKVLQFSTTLLMGNNTFVVTATNQAGSDTKIATVIYAQPQQIEAPPVITITQPIQPCQITTNVCAVVATITNITQKSQITVKHDGKNVSNFTWDSDSKQMIYRAPMANGLNNFEIRATNTGGSDVKTTMCTYNPPRVNTGGTGGGTTGGGRTGGGTTGGGTTTGGGGRTGTTGGTGGTTVNNPDGPGTGGGGGTGLGGGGGTGLGSRPNIAINSPAPCPANVTTSTVTFNVTVTDVPSASGIVVKVNGNQINNFSFSGTTLTFTANLNPGANSIEIIATNAIGTEVRACGVTYTSSAKPGTGGRVGGN